MSQEISEQALDQTLMAHASAAFGREDVEAVLADLGRHPGIGALDESNAAAIVVDGQTEITPSYLPHFPSVVASVTLPEGVEAFTEYSTVHERSGRRRASPAAVPCWAAGANGGGLTSSQLCSASCFARLLGRGRRHFMKWGTSHE